MNTFTDEKDTNKLMFKMGMLVGKLGLREEDIDIIIKSDLINPLYLRKEIMRDIKPYVTFMQEIILLLGDKIFNDNINKILEEGWQEKLRMEAMILNNEEKEMFKSMEDEELLKKCIGNTYYTINNVSSFSNDKNRNITNILANSGIAHEKIARILDVSLRTIKNYLTANEE